MGRVGWGLRSGERLDLSGSKPYNAVTVENIVRKERGRERERKREKGERERERSERERE